VTGPGEPRGVAEILGSVRDVLLDFDGPICRIFAGFPAREVASHLREVLESEGAELPEHIHAEEDPLNVFRFAAILGPDVCKVVESALRDAEVTAVASAKPTPHVAEFIEACQDSGRRIAVVSNNSHIAVESYLADHGLRQQVDAVAARTEPDPALMKPGPHLVIRALAQVEGIPDSAVLIGDSETDIASAESAGVRSIGFANKPGKERRLSLAGADAIVTTLTELISAIKASRGQPSTQPTEQLRW
jgi:phosphoglycolate phosphatase